MSRALTGAGPWPEAPPWWPLALLLAVLPAASVQAEGGRIEHAQAADGRELLGRVPPITRGEHARIVLSRPLERLAVGDESLVSVELLSDRELLALGLKPGRTSLWLWFDDGSVSSSVIEVVTDLGLLQRTLRDLDPNIRLDQAQDRDALVLTGMVPDVSHVSAAEEIVFAYFDPESSAPLLHGGSGSVAYRSAPRSSRAEDMPQLINLLRVRDLPMSSTQWLERTLRAIGGPDLSVLRHVQGKRPDDLADTFILEGSVADQTTLVRLLSAAAVILGREGERGGGINVLADEGGGLAREGGAQGGSAPFQLSSGGGGGGGLSNDIASNVARAQAVELLGGRVISFIDVRDLPQVRVEVQMYEVNRTALKSYSGGLRAEASTNDLRPGAEDSVTGILDVLGGDLGSTLSLVTSHLLLDLVFDALEEEGIARTLSRPTLTVLSGEEASFTVGGQVPYSQAFATDASESLSPGGVLQSVSFVSFGIQLRVRPLIGPDDRITMDVAPSVTRPDPVLTQAIVDSTGQPAPTTAFEVRSLQTTARLPDGEALLLGGLVSRDDSSARGRNPLPLLSFLSKSQVKQANDMELVIIVRPTIVRDRVDDVELWEFPDVFELIAQPQAPGAAVAGEAPSEPPPAATEWMIP